MSTNNDARVCPEEEVEKVAKLIGREGADDLGGGLAGFILWKGEEGASRCLMFGYAEGPLGYSEGDDNLDDWKSEGMPHEGRHDAEAQAAYIKATCAKLGYSLEKVS